MTSDDYMTEAQLAERWGPSRRTLQRWRVRGYCPAYVRLGRKLIFANQDVTAFETSRRVEPETVPGKSD